MLDHDDDATVLPIFTGPLVLVVADDLTHRSIVTRMVRTLGFPVRGCSTSTSALCFLRDHPRDTRLLLADLGLKRMDGGELAERARDLDPELRVLLMAAPGDPHVDDLLAGYHDLPFLSKPVHFGELAIVLADMLGTPMSISGQLRAVRRSPRQRTSGQHRA